MHRILFVLSLGACAACFGQASVQLVTDAAGYGPRVAPGSLASIFGTSLAGSTAYASGFPLPATLGGASVEISGASAPLLYASATQINFQVPSGLAAGDNTLVVHAPAGDSTSFTFTVTTAAPSIFQYGNNHVVAQNGDAQHTLNSSTNRAAAGSVITVYLTGQGALDNPVTDGEPAPDSSLSRATATSSASIGIQSAAIQFLGLTPGFAGLAQANITVPSLPTGDYPLVLTVGGYQSISAVVSVSGSGTPYTSPLTFVSSVAFTNSAASSVELYANTAYVCGENRITMVDVTNAAQPAVVGEFGDSTLNGLGTICAINTAGATPFLVDVVGPLVDVNGVADPMSLAVFSLADPRSPQLLTVLQTQYPFIVSLNFFSNYAFASTSYFTYQTSNLAITDQTGDFLAFDFTNPASPVFIATVTTLGNTNLMPASVVASQIYAFVASTTATGNSTAGTGTMDIVNITAPSAMFSIQTVSVPQAAILQSLDISGTVLLATGNTTGNRNPGSPDFGFTGNLTITTMDVTNPISPNILASFDTGIQVNGTFYSAGFTNGVFVIVNNAPVADFDGPQSLMIVDARQPANPIVYLFQTQFGFSGMVPTTTGYLLASTSLGLNIYQLQLQ